MSQLFVENKNEETFMMAVGFQCGSIHETEKDRGISHVLEHMMFRSNTFDKSLKLQKDFKKLGVTWNAYTTVDRTVYYVLCSSNICKRVVKLLLDITCKFSLSESEFKVGMNPIFEELSLNHRHDHSKSFWNILYDGTPYGNSVIGTKETLQNITFSKLRTFYNTHYGCPHIVTICHPKVYNTIKHMLPACRNNVLLPMDMNHNRLMDSKHRVVLYSDEERGNLCYLGYPASDSRSLACKFIAFILYHRLFEILREKHGVVYTPRVTYTSMLHIGHLCIHLKTSAITIPVLLKTVKKEIKMLQKINQSKYNLEVEAFKKHCDVIESGVTVAQLQKKVENSLFGVSGQQLPDMQSFKHICKMMFCRERCAFKFYTKSSVAMCLENTI